MKKELFKKYADIKNQIKELTEQSKDIQQEIEQTMEENEVDKVESDFGTFFFVERKRYIYSDELKEKEKQLKEQKKKEEETAEFNVIRSLSFRKK